MTTDETETGSHGLGPIEENPPPAYPLTAGPLTAEREAQDGEARDGEARDGEPEAQDGEAQDAARQSFWRRPAGRATAVVAALAVVGGGVGGGLAATSGGKDPAPRAQRHHVAAAPSFGQRADGTHYGAAADMLLPFPHGYRLGPDVPGIGADTVLQSIQWVAAFTSVYQAMPDADASSLAGQLDVQGALQYAVRSYVPTARATQSVQIGLVQVSDPPTPAKAQAWKDDVSEAFSSFHDQPTVPGYQGVRCYQQDDDETGLDQLRCLDVIGDVLVTFAVDGADPLDLDQSFGLLESQLHRLGAPSGGEV